MTAEHLTPFEKGHKKLGGRKKGTPNKPPFDFHNSAQEFAKAGLYKLAEMAGLITGKGLRESDNDQIKVTAIGMIFDRAWGKAPQAVTLAGDPNNPILSVQVTLTREQFLEQAKLISHDDDI